MSTAKAGRTSWRIRAWSWATSKSSCTSTTTISWRRISTRSRSRPIAMT